MQKTNKNEIDKKMNLYEKKIEETNMRLNDMHNITITQKEKIEKITDFQKFQDRTTDHLLMQELRLNNLQKDLNTSCAKYDRHYLDNLIVPGLVGDYCKFKNLKEFVDVIFLIIPNNNLT